MAKKYKAIKFIVCPSCGVPLIRKKLFKDKTVGRKFCPHCCLELPDEFCKSSGNKEK